jgi:hypothetical protein
MKKSNNAFIVMVVGAVILSIIILVVINGANHYGLRFVKFTAKVESISITKNENVVEATFRVISHEDLTADTSKSIWDKTITTTFLIEDLVNLRIGDTLDLICKMDYRYEPDAKTCVIAFK